MVNNSTKQALRKLGNDMRDARLRRRISTGIMSQRVFMSRATLHKIEKGDPGVSMGSYAGVLFVLGMLGRTISLKYGLFKSCCDGAGGFF